MPNEMNYGSMTYKVYTVFIIFFKVLHRWANVQEINAIKYFASSN